MDHLLHQLDQGSVLTKLFSKGKPEKRSFHLRRETQQLIWILPVSGRTQLEGAIDLRVVKEVRIGKGGKLFDKWSDDVRKVDPRQCFVILYGSTFRLKTVSCCGTSLSCFPSIIFCLLCLPSCGLLLQHTAIPVYRSYSLVDFLPLYFLPSKKKQPPHRRNAKTGSVP